MIDSNEFNDGSLVRGFQESGEMHYVDALVLRHIGKVRSMAYAMLLNDHDADDITQEIFLKITRSLDRFKAKANFSTWLHRITMNTIYDFLRRRQRNPVENHDDLSEHDSKFPTPDATLSCNESTDTIHAALAKLPPKLRAAITLTAINGLSASEAAHAEKCLAATMYWRIHEARRLLKGELKDILS